MNEQAEMTQTIYGASVPPADMPAHVARVEADFGEACRCLGRVFRGAAVGRNVNPRLVRTLGTLLEALGEFGEAWRDYGHEHRPGAAQVAVADTTSGPSSSKNPGGSGGSGGSGSGNGSADSIAQTAGASAAATTSGS